MRREDESSSEQSTRDHTLAWSRNVFDAQVTGARKPLHARSPFYVPKYTHTHTCCVQSPYHSNLPSLVPWEADAIPCSYQLPVGGLLLVGVVYLNACFMWQTAFDAYPLMYRRNPRPTICLLRVDIRGTCSGCWEMTVQISKSAAKAVNASALYLLPRVP